MVERTYVKTDLYPDYIHDFWTYILHNLSGVSIIKETEKGIQFSITEEGNQHLRLLSDCDFGYMIEGSLDEVLKNYNFF